jgi:diaminohydroxyphosphoribosylaminopyrimidine deaminase/5-amino-6-(5-phosphoribosylamino)uracil reductase
VKNSTRDSGEAEDQHKMRLALRLARRGYGTTSPNPMVGAVLVKGGEIIGRGWHHRAGEPHGEIEAILDAAKCGNNVKGATLYVTLEPCSTHGRTPPCTDAILKAGIKHVVIGATDPNPRHRGKGFEILRRGGVEVTGAVLAEECEQLNEAFNHWIVHHTPFVTVKAAMTLDGKIATSSGESKWITGDKARAYGMNLRQGADAILVGINTILADDPSLTVRSLKSKAQSLKSGTGHRLRRIILDSQARTPPKAKVVNDDGASLTTIVVSRSAPTKRVSELSKRANVIVAPGTSRSGIDLRWLLRRLGSENVTSLLVEGGGEVNASFLLQGLAQRVAFFYAPKIIGGRDSIRAVAGKGIMRLDHAIGFSSVEYRTLGPDLLLSARVDASQSGRGQPHSKTSRNE